MLQELTLDLETPAELVSEERPTRRNVDVLGAISTTLDGTGRGWAGTPKDRRECGDPGFDRF